MTDSDEQEIPVRPAATVMLIDDRADFQVFMMESNAATVFVGSKRVFPGGSVVDTNDREVFQHISI